MSGRRQVLMRCNLQQLSQWLQLPEGIRVAQIVSPSTNDVALGQFHIVLEGEKIPEIPEGFYAQCVTNLNELKRIICGLK